MNIFLHWFLAFLCCKVDVAEVYVQLKPAQIIFNTAVSAVDDVTEV